MSFPKTFLIIHDDYHADRIGKLPDGTQFFVSETFVPARDEDGGGEYLSVFVWEADGRFREARIDNFGPRATMDKDLARSKHEERMNELAGAVFCDILVSPFSVQHDGAEFGFIPQEETGGIELQPGNSMAFFPPWDGYYDT